MAYDTELDFSKLAALEQSDQPLESIAPKIITLNGQTQIDLPSNHFTKYADVMKDGAALILQAPDGSQIIIEGYFGTAEAPLLLAPDGTALTEGLVHSFAKPFGFVKSAQASTLTDESPIGGIKEVTGDVTIIRTSGESIQAKIGTPIYQGDQIETSGDGAANIMFVDETSFAISEDASLVIDEYVFDPSTHDGTTNFSMLRGVFMFTSGLIGKENPQNVDIDTPMGSIGIRGTVIAGDVTSGQVTIVQGAMFIESRSGNRVDLDSIFETARFEPSTGQVNNIGTTTAGDLGQTFASINGVAPDLFGVIGQSAQQIGDTSGGQSGQNAGQPSGQGPQGQGNNDQGQNGEAAGQEGPAPGEADGTQGPVEGQGQESGEAEAAGEEGGDDTGQDGETAGQESGDGEQNLDGEGNPADGPNPNETGFGDGEAANFGEAPAGFGEAPSADGGLGGTGDGTLGPAGAGPNGPAPGSNGPGPNQQPPSQNSDGTNNLEPPPPPEAINNLGDGTNSDGTNGGNTDGTAGNGTPASPDLILNASIAAVDGLYLTGADNLGVNVSVLHDFDGDGRDDFAFLDNDGDADIQVFGSATSTFSNTITTPAGTDAQGNNFESIGDFDADGNMDSILGLPSINTAEGDFQIINGPFNTTITTGAIIDTSGYNAGDAVGEDIAGIGDFNGDGFADVIFGSEKTDSNTLTDNGQAYVMFGGRTSFSADENVTKLGEPLIDKDFTQANVTRIRPFMLGKEIAVSIESGNNGFRIIDFDASGAPTDISGVVTNAAADGAVDAVFAHGYIYVYGDTADSIAIFDVLEPSSPTYVGNVDVSGLAPDASSRLFFDEGSNKLIFVSNTGATGNVTSYDLGNPVAPAIAGTTLGVAGWSGHTAAQLVGNTLFVAYGDSIDARPIDFSNPNNAATIRTYTNAGLLTGVTDIKYDAENDLVYAVSPVDGQLVMIDVSLATPTLAGDLAIAGATGVEFYTEDGSGKKLAFVTTNTNNAVEVVDVSTPGSPSIVDTITDGAMALDGVTNVYLNDGLLFVQSTSGIMTIELNDTVGRVIDGVNNSEFLGDNVSSAGDFNNDGFDDFIVTSPGINSLHIVLGNEDGTIDMNGGAIHLNSINVDAGDLEIPVFMLGDINGDGISDIGVVENAANSGFGQIRILNGGNTRSGANDSSLTGASNVTINLAADYTANMTAGQDGIIGGSAAGNFDGDGYDDGVIAVRNGDTIDIFVLDFDAYAGNSTLTLNPDVDNAGIYHMQYTMPAAFTEIEVDFAATDFDGDGFDDLVVSFTDPSSAQTGESFVLYGYDYSGATIQGTAVSATNNGDELVGGDTNDTLDDSGLGLSNLSFRAGDGDDVMEVAGVSQSYTLTSAASENTNATNAGAIWALDPKHIFIGNNSSLKLFNTDFISGTISEIDTSIIGASNVEDIMAQGRFAHVAGGSSGLQSWSFGGGTLTNLDTETTNIANARAVWVDGGDIFVADLSNGLVAVGWDGSTYSHIDTIASGGNTVNDVWGDGSTDYVYLAAGNRLEAFGWDGASFTFKDSDTGRNADYVWSDGDNVYSVSGDTLNAYTFDGTTLTHVKSITIQGDGTANSLHGDKQYIYVTSDGGSSDGIEYFRFDGADFSSVQYVETTTYQDVFTDGDHVYVAAAGDGVKVFNAENIFSDGTFNKYDGGDGIDILRLSANDSALDLSALGSEALSGFEVLEMAGTDQIIQIGIEDIFDLLQNSDNSNTLTINANNDISNQLIISDNVDGNPQRPGMKYLVEEMGFSELSSTNINGVDYKQFSFGSYTLNIDEVLVDNGNLQVA